MLADVQSVPEVGMATVKQSCSRMHAFARSERYTQLDDSVRLISISLLLSAVSAPGRCPRSTRTYRYVLATDVRSLDQRYLT